MACEARQEGDEMACACGLRWAVADIEPPQCRRVRHVVPVPAAQRELLVGARKEQNFLFAQGGTIDPLPNLPAGRRFWAIIDAKIPTRLPDPVARAMVLAFRSVERSDAEAMQAAYRVFLDSLP